MVKLSWGTYLLLGNASEGDAAQRFPSITCAGPHSPATTYREIHRMCKASAILFAAAALAAPLRAQSTVDTAGSGALIAQALDRSEVMENLRISAT